MQVLQKYIDYLTDAITDPVALAAELSEAKLISDVTRKKANNDNSCQVTRNYHILNELMVAVAINPTNLMKIISVLQGHHHPHVSAIAEKMITGKTTIMSILHTVIW